MAQLATLIRTNPALRDLQRRMPVKQWRFVMHFASMGFEHGKGAEAARRAGYAEGSAAVTAHQLQRLERVNQAIAEVKDWLESTDEIDEHAIIAGLAREAFGPNESKDRISALIALAKVRRMGAFGGTDKAPGGPGITQNVLILQSMGVDAGTGRVSDASKFAESLARAFGAEAAAGMLAQAGMQGAAAALTGAGSVVIEADVSPSAVDNASLEHNQAVDSGASD